MTPIIARVNVFTAFSERPGEPGYFVDNALVDLKPCEPFVASQAIVDKVQDMLKNETNVEIMLNSAGTEAEFVLVRPILVVGEPILTDGEGRYFHYSTRRPVNRGGQFISLEEAEHNARNHARQKAAYNNRQMRKAA
jgi:hypothetical protein